MEGAGVLEAARLAFVPPAGGVAGHTGEVLRDAGISGEGLRELEISGAAA
jgi:hypothetical protein